MSRGVLMYAHNNTEIDYIKIACANALMVKKHLGVPVTVVTDQSTISWAKKTIGTNMLDNCFDTIIEIDTDRTFSNNRNYKDFNSSKTLKFYNCNHWEAYDLSPYDETLFVDSDYLIMSDILNACWGSTNEFMINSAIIDTDNISEPYSELIDAFSIVTYWATVIYFKKSLLSRSVFDLVKHVQDNYGYYKQLYSFKNTMFRNDYAFSIAVHIINNFQTTSKIISSLPVPGLLMSWDNEDVLAVNGVDDITIYTSQDKQTKLARFKNQDIHIMNKWAINRHADQLIELYK